MVNSVDSGSGYDADGYRIFDDSLKRDSRGRDNLIDAASGRPYWRHYRYQELQQGQIRLLSLKPGDRYDEIYCELQIQKLNNAPEFEALSYCCGSDTPPAFIKLDGKYLQVTRNLKLALAYLRRKNGTRRMWIDAICINQEDNEEKAAQVQMMHDIYKQSVKTTVWLEEGPPGFPGTDEAQNLRAFDLCERIEKSLQRDNDTSSVSSKKSTSHRWRAKLRGQATEVATDTGCLKYSDLQNLQLYAEALEFAYEHRQVSPEEDNLEQASSRSDQPPIEGLRQLKMTGEYNEYLSITFAAKGASFFSNDSFPYLAY